MAGIQKIRKRDGRIVDFQPERITNAIFKAAQAMGGTDRKMAEEACAEVVRIAEERFKDKVPSVEDVQDLVEKVLIERGHAKTAKAYILYRKQHSDIRSVLNLLNSSELVESYIKLEDWRVKENANMSYSLQGLNFHISSAVVSTYWLNKLYTSDISEAHKNGDFHIHDLGILGAYCVGWDLRDLLLQGFGHVSGKIASKPAKHFRTALGQVVNFFYTLQGEAAGAQAFSSFDSYLAPYIRYDNLGYDHVKQCLQEFLFNINVPTRVGFQSPFTNVTLDLTIPEMMKNEPAIVGGKMMDDNYGDFVEEIKMFNEAFAELMTEGDANGRVFTFPIPTYNITRSFDWDAPVLEKIFKMTSKYGVPYFSNFVNSDMKPEDARSMCLHAKEEIVYKKDGHVERADMKGFAEGNCYEFDGEGWADPASEVEVASLNPETMKMEWKEVKRFLRVKDRKSITIGTRDGKTFTASENHLVSVLTPDGLKEKLAKDVETGDYVFSLKDGACLLGNSCAELDGRKLDEELAFLLGFFTADGNFLWKANCVGEKAMGVQFSFNAKSKELVAETKERIRKVWGVEAKEKKDPRYNTVYLYVYRSKIAETLWKEGFRKHGRVPAKLYDSPKTVIEAFLNGFFEGDGYEKRKEIHINDSELARDLATLYGLVGVPTIFRRRKNSQIIYLQNKKSEVNAAGAMNSPCLYEYVPGFLAKSTYVVPGLHKDRMVGTATLQKYKAHTIQSEKLIAGNVYPVRVSSVTRREHENEQEFYDVELEENHLFMHSLGTITHNCCRLRIDNRELRKRGGGLFGANPLTGCYDDRTEILTEAGWKLFKDLTKEDVVFTLSEDNVVEAHKPRKLFAYDWNGEMYSFKTKSLDLLVTPNHRMVVNQTYQNKRRFIEARDFDVNNHCIPKQSKWIGEEQAWFVLPAINFVKYGRQGRTPYGVTRDTLRIEMDSWLAFFGFWLAEGCTDNEKIAKRHGYRVIITQVNNEKRQEIKKVLDSLPFNYYEERGRDLVICNKQLWSYLRQFGDKYVKYVPRELKRLSRRQLKILFDWMVKGDGHIRKTTAQINYWTASKKLADDLQEIIMKLGWLGTLTVQKPKVSQIKGRPINAREICVLGVQKAKAYRLRKNNVSKAHYKGRVYCCEVPNHAVLVRRNGRVSWCGNSVGVVTLNMPRIGYLSKDEKQYFERLDTMMELAKQGLETKRKVLEGFTEKGLYPYSKFYLRDIKKQFGGYWKNHFATVGLIGMNESLLNFMGKDIADVEGKKFAMKVLDYIRLRLTEFQNETGNIYNLEATPGEGTSYRLARLDKKTYPKIIVANEKAVRDRKAPPYYTNSSHLAVYKVGDIFEALDHQDDLQTKYTGGTVLHGFIGERISDWRIARDLVRKITSNYKLPYFTLTPTFSICPKHGYLSGEHKYCPKCDAEIGYVEAKTTKTKKGVKKQGGG